MPHLADRYGDPLPEGAVARLGTIRWRQPLRDGSGFARVSFSPDGKTLISTGDCGLCLWEVSTGKQVSWAPEGARIRAAVFTPDGKTLITQAFGPRNGPPTDPYQLKCHLQHWEVGTGRRLRETEFDLAHEFTSFPHLAADGKLFVCNERDKKVSLWDTVTGQRRFKIAQELNYWDPVSLSADNRFLAVIGKDRHMRLFDAATGKELRQILWEGDQPFTGYYAPALAPDGKLLAASTPTTLRVWDTATGELKRELAEVRGVAAFSADGRYLACGDRKGIHLWETATFGEVRRFAEPHGQVSGLAFSADGRLLASAGEHTVGVWDVATGKPLNFLPAHVGVVYALTFTPPGTGVVSGSDDGTALVWDLTTATPRHRLPGHYLAAASLACSPDGRLLATGDGQPYGGLDSREAQIRLWNLSDGSLLRQFTGHLHGVHRLAFAPDGSRLVSGGYDARFRVWDPATGKRLYQVRGNEGTRTLAFSPDGRTLALGTSRGDFSLVQADTGQMVRDLGAPQGDQRRRVVHVAFARDGKTVISEERDDNRGGAGPRTRIWDFESGREIRSVPIPGSYPYFDNAPSAHAVSPDGSVAVTVGERAREPTIQLWDLLSGKLFAALRGHAGAITVAAFSPDGKLLASGSRDTTVLVWDVVEIRMKFYWSELQSGAADTKNPEALMADPAKATAFLKGRLTRSAQIETEVRRRIAELDDNQFAVREKASRELIRLSTAAEAILRQAAKDHASEEVRQRLRSILNGLKDREKAEPALGPEGVRMAITLLERIDTPDSRRAIEELARGPADAATTREARAALERLKKSERGR